MNRKRRFGMIVTTLALLALGPAVGLRAGTPGDSDQGRGRFRRERRRSGVA
jgi:hypothetical protein